MKLLSISTSAKTPSAALCTGGGIRMLSDTSGSPHSVSLMRLIDELLCAEGSKISDMDAFCVDVGPGSFTGVRIGVSAANAFALAVGKPVVPVSSLAAIRHLAPADCGTVCAMLDAKGGKGYAAVYSGNNLLIEPCACVQSELAERVEREFGRFTAVGDCFGGDGSVDAELILREALLMIDSKGEGAFAANAVPMYLRPSQAERMRKGGTDAR